MSRHIKEFRSQNRRDFRAIFQCEHCKYEVTRDGYDDTYFHNVVIPNMRCPNCDKTASSSYRPYAPKYPDHMEI